MATSDSIYQQIKAYLNGVLPQLNNSSGTSVLNRLITVFSNVINTVYNEIANSKTVIEQTARTLRVMDKQWYVDKAVAYQDGTPLVVTDAETLAMGYAVVDEGLQIIKQVSVSAVNGQIAFQVCTTDDTGNNIPLTAAQQGDFTDYIGNFIPLGLTYTVASDTPNVIGVSGTLYVRYYATYSLTAIKSDLQAFFIDFQQQIIGGKPLYVNDIEAAIASVAGVRDAYFDGIQVDSVDVPASGLITLSAGSFNFSSTLQDLTNVTFQSV